jgi:hypothetical protein
VVVVVVVVDVVGGVANFIKAFDVFESNESKSLEI